MKKKKKGKVFLLGLAVLILLLTAEIALNQMNKREAEKETEEETEVNPLSISSDELQSVTVENEYGVFTFTKKEDVWENVEDAEFPLDQDSWAAKLSYLDDLSIVRTLDKPEDLAEYGLADPDMEMILVAEDGSENHVYVGDVNKNTGDYYIYVNTDATIYTVGSSLIQEMNCKLYDLADGESFPTISSGTLTHLEIRNGESTLEVQSGDGYSWTVSRNGTDEVDADSSAVSTLTSSAGSMVFEEFVDYKGDNLAQYGLDVPAAEEE